MNVETHGVSFAAGGKVIGVDDKPVVLFARELLTYRDLPGSLAGAVGKALGDQCFIAIGYRQGPGSPLFAVIIEPGSGTNSQNTCLYVTERPPGIASTELLTHLHAQLRNGVVKIATLDRLLQQNEPLLNKPDFFEFNKEAVHAAVQAVGNTMDLLRFTTILSSSRQAVEPRIIFIGELLSGRAGGSRLPAKWRCHGDETLTFCGEIDRLNCLFRLLKGWLGDVEAAIHWTEDAQTLGVSAVKLEITTGHFDYRSFFRHAEDGLAYADVDGGWKCALRDMIIDAQGRVEFAPDETQTRLRIWLPLNLPDSF